jgi:hypothetical protein
VWSNGGLILTGGKTVVLREKSVALPICAPQILHILNRLQTFASGPSGRHLKAQFMELTLKSEKYCH